MNLNQLAKEISKLEGGAHDLSIAQIKEVLACFACVMKNISLDDKLWVALIKAGVKKEKQMRKK